MAFSDAAEEPSRCGPRNCGQSAAKSLALTDPARALDNADNHEYFAENTPSQN